MICQNFIGVTDIETGLLGQEIFIHRLKGFRPPLIFIISEVDISHFEAFSIF